MKKILLITMVVLVMAAHGWATPILVDSSNLIGLRSTPISLGLVASDGWTQENGGFKISWNISQVGDDWSYSYTFTKTDGSQLTKNVSHWILEVSPIITAENVYGYIFNTNFTLEGPEIWTESQSNPYMPEEIYGIKLDTGLTIYTFMSTQAPIWGDFYAKDGKQSDIWATAWNTGIGTDPIGSPFTNWIPVLDTTNGGGGGQDVPEPGTLLLLGSGLIGLAFYGRRKFNKKI